LSSQWRFATERYWFRAGPILKGLGTVMLLTGAAYLGNEGWRAGRESYWLRRAKNVGQPPNHYDNPRVEALQQALAADPKNFETTYQIGYCYWMRSLNGGDNYVAVANQAIDWYRRGLKLNPWSCYDSLGIGMCLDWIGSTKKDSGPYYERALALDPNSYFVTAHVGWHYVQTGDLAAARTWLERSRRLEWVPADNEIAYEYLPIVERRLQEQARERK